MNQRDIGIDNLNLSNLRYWVEYLFSLGSSI